MALSWRVSRELSRRRASDLVLFFPDCVTVQGVFGAIMVSHAMFVQALPASMAINAELLSA